MNEILAKIVGAKKESLSARKKEVPFDEIKDRALGRKGIRSLRNALSREDRINIIAEIKRASPSAGIICPDFDPVRIAREYTRGGAAAVSVLTEEKFFLGDISYLQRVREQSPLPVLRKDFVFDPYQIYESLAYGADAVLLIAALLEMEEL
ncbi:MAG: indole-3-glycerol phosphate synthase TrpC, partial [Endomicrobiales bacterium]